MKTFTQIRLLFALITIIFFQSGCSKKYDAESLVVQSTTEICFAQTDLEGDCQAEDLNQLDRFTARVALAAEDIIKNFGSESDRLILDELDSKILLSRARNTIGDLAPDDLPSTRIHSLDITDDTKSSFVKPALSALADISRSYSSAALEQDLQKIFVDLEAKLRVIQRNYMDQPNPIKSPFGLLEPKTLADIESSLKSKYRTLSLYNSLLGVNERGTPLAKMLDERITKIREVKEADWYNGYHKDEEKPYIKYSEKDWEAAQRKLNREVELERTRLYQLLETTTGWPELQVDINGIRGPPLDILLQNNLRSYDIAISEWTRSEARLQALSDELVENTELPENYRVKSDKSKHRLLALLEDGSLQRAKVIVKSALAESNVVMPEQNLYLEKIEFYRAWEQAIDEELKRRKTGRAVDYQRSTKINALVSQCVDTEQLPSNRAQARFVGVLDQRFGNNKTNIPISLMNDYQKYREQALLRSAEDISGLVDRFQKVNTISALSTKSISGSKFDQSYRRARDYFIALVSEYEDLSKFAKNQGVMTEVADDKTERALSLFAADRWNGNSSPDPLFPNDSGPQPKGPNDGGNVGHIRNTGEAKPNILVTSYDLSVLEKPRSPSFEKYLYRVEAYLAHAETQLSKTETFLDEINIGPIDHGTQTGRRVVSESALRRESISWHKLRFDDTAPRLADNLRDWKGRLTSGGEPYKYLTEVIDPKTFNALGGGIHFGIVATLQDDLDLSSHTIIYQQGEEYGKLILRNGKNKSELVLLDELNPVSTKALYRFSTAGRNAAISIGWASDEYERGNSGYESESTILIDPYLVDTKVGQDLILADSIPWDFAEPIFSSGKKVSFADEFRAISESRLEKTLIPYRKFIDESMELIKKPLSFWTQRLDQKLPRTSYYLAIFALLFEDNLVDSRNWYIGSHYKEVLNTAGIELTDPKKWEEGLRKLIIKSILDNHKRENIATTTVIIDENEFIVIDPHESNLNKRITNTSSRYNIARRMIKLKEYLEVKQISENFDRLTNVDVSNRRQALGLLDALIQHKAKSGQAERVAVEFLLAEEYRHLDASTYSGHNSIENKLALSLYGIINPTTLAVLYDKKVDIRISENNINFDSELEYRYATNYIKLGKSMVGIGHAENDPDNQVETISSLTTLVNNNIDELFTLYPPMARMKKYSEISALFRWANAAQKEGKLGGINLAEFGQFPANDPNNYPTADLLIKERKN